jgi:hypothetical protein
VRVDGIDIVFLQKHQDIGKDLKIFIGFFTLVVFLIGLYRGNTEEYEGQDQGECYFHGMCGQRVASDQFSCLGKWAMFSSRE